MERIRNRLRIKNSVISETYWDITKSGKVLEFRVRPSMEQNPEQYRLGIIQIGRIISIIQNLARQTRSKPQIQLFPNLSETQLAATVYWPEFLFATNMDPAQSKPDPDRHHPDIKELAQRFSLTASLCEDSNDQDLDKSQTMYIVSSSSNQPFIWIKIGRFIQEMSDLIKYSDSSKTIVFEILPGELPERSAIKRLTSYKQLKVLVKTEIID